MLIQAPKPITLSFGYSNLTLIYIPQDDNVLGARAGLNDPFRAAIDDSFLNRPGVLRAAISILTRWLAPFSGPEDRGEGLGLGQHPAAAVR